MSETKNSKYKVLRVTQLDAELYEYQLYDLLKEFLIESFKDGPFTMLLNFQPEISAFLRFVMWNFSVKKINKTFGQEILGTEFQNKNGTISTVHQKRLFGFNVVILKWLFDRQEYIVREIKMFTKSKDQIAYVEKLLSCFQTVSQILTFLNFIQFLKTGDHVNLLERMLNLTHVHSNIPTPRYIDYNYKRREMMWENISGTILCLLPFINFRMIMVIINKISLKLSTGETKKFDNKIDFTCAVCRELPTHPYCGECKHVYCYYCIQSNISSSGSFLCYYCSYDINEIKPVKHLK